MHLHASLCKWGAGPEGHFKIFRAWPLELPFSNWLLQLHKFLQRDEDRKKVLFSIKSTKSIWGLGHFRARSKEESQRATLLHTCQFMQFLAGHQSPSSQSNDTSGPRLLGRACNVTPVFATVFGTRFGGHVSAQVSQCAGSTPSSGPQLQCAGPTPQTPGPPRNLSYSTRVRHHKPRVRHHKPRVLHYSARVRTP